MHFYKFDKTVGRHQTGFNSDFMASHILKTKNQTHISFMHLEQDGVIGYHKAAVPQLLMIMTGQGFVCGNDKEFINVQAGEAVYWDQNEWHETKTRTGMTALVLESNRLDVSALTPITK